MNVHNIHSYECINCIILKLNCCNYIIALISSSSSTAAGAAIGGAVGGAVLLISLVWCVLYRYKRKKESYSTNQPHFAPSKSVSGNPRYLYELKDMKNTEINMGMEARMCK